VTAESPQPGDRISVSRWIPGPRWIANRDRPCDFLSAAGTGVPWEAVWWLECLGRLDEALRTHALGPGPVIEREIRYDERDRSVTLFVETRATEPADGTWGGLPRAMLTTVDGLAGCPSPGDSLAVSANRDVLGS
jgi:hypothetical protein